MIGAGDNKKVGGSRDDAWRAAVRRQKEVRGERLKNAAGAKRSTPTPQRPARPVDRYGDPERLKLEQCRSDLRAMGCFPSMASTPWECDSLLRRCRSERQKNSASAAQPSPTPPPAPKKPPVVHRPLSQNVSREINRQCLEKAPASAAGCVDHVSRRVQVATRKVCEKGAGKLSVDTCQDFLVSFPWRNVSQLEAKAGALDVTGILQILRWGKEGMVAADQTNHHSLIFFIGKEVELFAAGDQTTIFTF